MSLREGVLSAPNLTELNILEKALTSLVDARRNEILEFYKANNYEVMFVVHVKRGKRKVKAVGRGTVLYTGKEYVTVKGTYPSSIIGKKVNVPKAWLADLQGEAFEIGPEGEEDKLPEENPETRAAMEGVQWE